MVIGGFRLGLNASRPGFWSGLNGRRGVYGTWVVRLHECLGGPERVHLSGNDDHVHVGHQPDDATVEDGETIDSVTVENRLLTLST